MTDLDLEKIRAAVREVITPLEADAASLKGDVSDIKGDVVEVKAVQAEQTRDIALLRQDVAKIRNTQIGQELKLDDVQDFFSRICEGMDHRLPPAVLPLGEGRVTEIRQMHSQINAVERKMAEFQARMKSWKAPELGQHPLQGRDDRKRADAPPFREG